MAESRAKRMQVVLTLAERTEQQAGQQLTQCQMQVDAEIEQLQHLEDYATQYLHTYSERKSAVKPQELIAYSGFLQRLGDARAEQTARLNRIKIQLERLRQAWQIAHQKCESIKDLIRRLLQEENHAADKQLQKEQDELVSQAYSRRENHD